MKTFVRSVLVALCCTLPAGLTLAEDGAPAAPQPEAPATGSEVKPDAEHEAKVFSLKVGGDEQDGEKAHGITITVDGDEEEVKIAGKVVDRVITDLETALADLPEDVRAELDTDDVDDLRRALEDVRRLKQGETGSGHDGVNGGGFTEEIIPGIVAIVLLFGGPIVIVAIVSFNNRRKRQMVHQTIDKIIEQGREVPVELLDALDKGQNGKSRLARGTVNVALGLGLGTMLLITAGPEVASIGLIPLWIGLAHLLVWKLEKTPEDRSVTG